MINDLTYTRLLLLEIREIIDEPVVINDSIVKSLHLNLATENYSTIRMIHGKKFMQTLINLYSDCELYEVCAKMKFESDQVDELETGLR